MGTYVPLRTGSRFSTHYDPTRGGPSALLFLWKRVDLRHQVHPHDIAVRKRVPLICMAQVIDRVEHGIHIRKGQFFQNTLKALNNS